MPRQSRLLHVALLLAGLFATPAVAHSLRVPQDSSGISVPALAHGQMAVIAEHRAEIETLATWIAPRDLEVRKLLSFARAQAARCLWGLMPRSIEDEASPFNHCSHAYLAADRALLIRIRQLPYWPQIVQEVQDRVEKGMIEQGSSLVLCLFSATSFNTASLVNPDAQDFLMHAPTLLTLLAILAAFCLLFLASFLPPARHPAAAGGKASET